MKKSIIIVFLAIFTAFSCSTDNEDDSGNTQETTINLLGTWVLTDLRIDENTNDDDLNFAKQLLDAFSALDCDIVTFTFRNDNTVTSEDKTNFIIQNVTAGAGGLSVDCPTESVSETTTWSLDGDQLTFINDDLEEETITIELEDENTLIIAGSDINTNNYTGADAVFTKQ